VERFRAKAAEDGAAPDSFISSRSVRREGPLGLEFAMHYIKRQKPRAATRGLGLHSFRRANITFRRQQVAAAPSRRRRLPAQRFEMTGEYTFVTPERQNELTRADSGCFRSSESYMRAPPNSAFNTPAQSPTGALGHNSASDDSRAVAPPAICARQIKGSALIAHSPAPCPRGVTSIFVNLVTPVPVRSRPVVVRHRRN
jgi:hypothetical protein